MCSSRQDEPLTVLTVSDVLERLKIGRTTLYTEIRSGRLETFKVGRRRLVTRQALADYISHAQGDLVVSPATIVTTGSDLGEEGAE
jgi:excisionase family DNA binding protein